MPNKPSRGPGGYFAFILTTPFAQRQVCNLVATSIAPVMAGRKNCRHKTGAARREKTGHGITRLRIGGKPITKPPQPVYAKKSGMRTGDRAV